MPRLKSFSLCAAVFPLALTAPGIAQTTEPGWQWRSVRMDGMGFVTGIMAHPQTSDVYAKTDVGGVYRFDRGQQRWLSLIDSLPLFDAPASCVESLALDATNPSRVAILAARDSNRQSPGGGDYKFGDVMTTIDGGANWQSEGLLPLEIRIGCNGEYRGFSGERLALDPRRPERILVASRVNGVWIKESSQSSWTRSAGDPVVTPWPTTDPNDLEYAGNTPGHTCIVFDPGSAATSDGATSLVYLGDHATGVWQSSDAGRTWTRLTGSPIHPVHAAVHTDGLLYVSCARFAVGPDESLPEIGSVHRYNPASQTWTEITPPVASNPAQRDTSPYAGISTHPTDANVVMLTAAGGSLMYRSVNKGQSWTRIEYSDPANSPAYFEPPSAENYFVGATDWGTVGILIDPIDPNVVWQTNGFGVIRNDNIVQTPQQWSWVMRDFEELVVHTLACPPVPREEGGAALLSAVMDMVALRHDRTDVVPSVKGAHPLVIGQANSIAYSSLNPNHAAIVGWDTWRPWFTLSGITSDNGRTWTPFPDTTPGQGGALAMSATTPTNILWEPAQWRFLHVTRDGGATWEIARDLDAVFDPANTDPDYQQNWWKVGAAWHVSNPWWTGQHLAADKVNGNRFYRYTWGQFKYSNDGGGTWRNGFNAWQLPQGPGIYSVRTRLITHPVREGEVWIAEYPNNDQPPTPPHRSTDGGLTLQRINSLSWATSVAFGKGATPALPDIYIHGVPVGATQEGIYVSRDDAQTWTLISFPAVNKFATINALEADMRQRNIVYVGTAGRGIFVGQLGQSCDPIDFNNDGVSPDTDDIDDFLSVFGGGPCSNDPNCNDIDFNNDGVSPDSGDIDAFLRVFSGGACGS